MKALLDAGANPNATELARGHTPLMFAAAADRLDAARLLLARGADPNAETRVVDLAALSRDGDPDGRNLGQPAGARGGASRAEAPAGGRPARAPQKPRVAGVDRQFLLNELVASEGGMTPLLFAARQGYADLVTTLLDAGVSVNQLKGGDGTSALLIATINGQFDLGRLLLERGADPNLAAENGATPLYAAINVQWAPRTLYPQPRAYLDQRIGYLDLMKLLLDKGANPNARLKTKVWYSGYNFDQSGVDEIGATPFWRAAYGADVDAMKLLVAYGADPNIPTMKPRGAAARGRHRRPRLDRRVGSAARSGRRARRAAAARGVGRRLRRGLRGQLAPLRADGDAGGREVSRRGAARRRQYARPEGNTALHHAAARGDNEMILYLVSKGADVRAVNARAGRRWTWRTGLCSARGRSPRPSRCSRSSARQQPQVRVV